LKDELADGLVLINLVEILSGERCPEKYNPKPTLEIHKLENVTIAINFIQKFVKVSISANDIVQANMRLILGLIWRLILTFKVESKEDDNEKLNAAQRNRAARKKLLDWCVEKTKDHRGVNITDFGASWYDGLAFCALIHAFNPSLIDYDSLSAENAASNLELAFDLAEKHLDIPRLLDPADICAQDVNAKPDEQCFMTYLSEFPLAFLAHQEQAASKESEEAKRKKEEEEARRKAEEEARRKAEEEERKRRAAEEEELKKKKADLEAQAEALRKKESEDKAKKEEEERRRRKREEKAARAAKKKQEEDEAKRQAELDAREAEHEAERLRLEEECRRLRAELDATKERLIGKLKVSVIEARSLKESGLSKVDPYCVLFLERQKEKTKTIRKTSEPKWEANFEFYHSDPDAVLNVSVFDWNRFLSDDFLGKLEIPISDLEDGTEVDTWYKLLPKKKKDKSITGEVHLKLLYSKEH
jgi:hypothetical protein